MWFPCVISSDRRHMTGFLFSNRVMPWCVHATRKVPAFGNLGGKCLLKTSKASLTDLSMFSPLNFTKFLAALINCAETDFEASRDKKIRAWKSLLAAFSFTMIKSSNGRNYLEVLCISHWFPGKRLIRVFEYPGPQTYYLDAAQIPVLHFCNIEDKVVCR